MGIVNSVAVLLVLAFLWFGYFKLRRHLDSSDPIAVWASRIALATAALGTLWFVTTFIHPIKSPFDGPKATDLPAHPEKPKLHRAPAESKAQEPKPNEFDKAEAHHKERLEKFKADGVP